MNARQMLHDATAAAATAANNVSSLLLGNYNNNHHHHNPSPYCSTTSSSSSSTSNLPQHQHHYYSMTLAGSVKETVHRIHSLVAPERMAKIAAAVSSVVVWEELLLFFILGFVLPLLFRLVEHRKQHQSQQESSEVSSPSKQLPSQKQRPQLQHQQTLFQKEIPDGDAIEDDDHPSKQCSHCHQPQQHQHQLNNWSPPRNYYTNKPKPTATGSSGNSIHYTIASNVAQVAQLAFAIYMVDIIKVVLVGVGFEFSQGGDLTHSFANILYMMWILNRLSAMKRFVLAKHTKSDPDNLGGQVQLVDRLVDACLYCMGLYVTVDSAKEDMGAAAKGFVALGSVGTLVISLASQGLAAQLFNGLFLASSNRIAVGDFVRFANGVSGTVIKLGWMETIIRAPDEVMITVPNKDLADQRVSNLSRVPQSAVKQTLRFKYKDIEKLPAVLETIKDEIKQSCPDLIADGSRPFRASLTAFKEDHISAHLDCRFRLKPLGSKFYVNRQNVLLAINRAVKQHDVEFAVLDVTAVSTALRHFTTVNTTSTASNINNNSGIDGT